MAYTDLIISEYIEGSSNNKALEFYNGTGTPIDLAAGGYVVQMYFNGSTSAGLTINLSGTVAPGDVFVLAHASAASAILAQADQTNSSGWYNGDDAVVLRKGGTGGAVVDSIGQVGFDPGTEWGTGLVSTADNTLTRKTSVSAGDTSAGDAFDPAAQWDGAERDTFSDLGRYGGGGGGGDPAVPALISAVQGSGAQSPMLGRAVTVEAIVVGDFQGTGGLGGFFLQEEDADADGIAATSEGLFVYQGGGSFAEVTVGDRVRVTGIVTEYASGTSSLTELARLTEVTVLASAQPLPATTALAFPLADAAALESLEGMQVAVATTMAVTATDTLGRYGEVLLASDGPGNQPGTDARLDTYTQFNTPDASGYADYLDQVALRRLVLDDGQSGSYPTTIVHGRGGAPLSASNTLRGGDTVQGLVGILDDRFGSADTGAYRLQPTQAADFQPTSERMPAPDVGGRIVVASMNVLNYFTTLGSRGADTALEFERQQAKIVAAIDGLDADVVGLIELQNNGWGAGSAIGSLVEALNLAAGAGTWAAVDPGQPTLGTDEITVGLIYRTATVSPVGAAAVLDSSVDPRFDSSAQRPSLAQTFRDEATGALFTPVVNHLKSKGSSAGLPGDADQGDGQGLSNATRTQAALALADWLATDPTGQGDADYLVLGDLNAYAMEDPLMALRAGADDVAGTTDDLVDLLSGSSASFEFGGQWGALDHALATASLATQVSGAAKWHINADEPAVLDYNTENKTPAQQTDLYAADAYRSSDHDPVRVGLDPGLTVGGTARTDVLVGSIGADSLQGGQGRDLLVGGSGRDRYIYTSVLDSGDAIVGFELGADRLMLDTLLAQVGYVGSDPAADGRVLAWPVDLSAGAGLFGHTLVMLDVDGPGGADPTLLVDLIGVLTADAGALLG